MVKSVFRYEEIPDGEKPPLQHCNFGNYYKNAKKPLPPENVGNDVGKDEEEQKYKCKCVIMDYEHDQNHAIEQIELSHEMGVEYALEVLHVDNTTNESDSEVKVIYRHFKDTVSGWLQELEKEKLEKASEINKKLKDEVIPITRKLWKLLDKMKKKGIRIPNQNNDQGYWMPLISGVPLVLNLNKDEGYLDLKYPVTIINKVLGGCKDKSLSWLEEALKFWKDAEPSDAGKHPALYGSAEKSRFLALFHRCTFYYGLEAWLDLDGNMNWIYFQDRFNGSKFQKVYEEILNYKYSNPYTRGSDVVRYTRNALAHFEDNYKQIHRQPWDCGEVVEILNEDLAVCSLHYKCARDITEIDQPPIDLTEEDWKKTQAIKWKELTRQKLSTCGHLCGGSRRAQAAANVIIEAYQPAPLEIYTNGGWKPVTEEIVANPQLLFKTDWGWKRGVEVFNGANQPPRLWTNEVWRESCREDWRESWRESCWKSRRSVWMKGWRERRKGWREGWKEAEEIKKEADQTVSLKFNTYNDWMTTTDIIKASKPLEFFIWDEGDDKVRWKQATDIIKAEQPPRLLMKKGRAMAWIEAFEVDQPLKILEKENWDEARKKLKKFLAPL